MKRVFQLTMMLLLPILPVLPAQSAQPPMTGVETAIETTCPSIVQQAWENIDALCHDIDRNEACYGHVLLNAQPQPGVTRFAFEREGQTVDVVKLQSLRLSTMDLLNGTWGVALLQIQANLPAVVTDRNVSLLLFGDVALENAATTETLIDVTPIAATNTINVRYRPTTRSGVVGLVGPDDVVTADGRLAGNPWLHIQASQSGVNGWVYAPLFESVDGVAFDTLPEVDASVSNFGPMQAFYFQSGGQDAMCPEAPNSGILIQTPEGVAEVTLLINEVDIRLGSTVFFQAEPNGDMSVSVVEGHARVTAGGVTHTAYAGSQVTVPLDENGHAAGIPSQPHGYDMASVAGLPVEHMEIPVAIAEPLSDEEIQMRVVEEAAAAQQAAAQQAAVQQAAVSQTDADDGGGDSVSNPGQDGSLPPGLVDNPGLGDNLPPGQGGDLPPGQAKDKDNNGKKP